MICKQVTQVLSHFLAKHFIFAKKMLLRFYRQFFSELAGCSPAYGIFQAREEQCVFDVLKMDLSGDEDIFNSTNHTDLRILKTHIPILVKFLEAATRDGQGKALSHCM